MTSEQRKEFFGDMTDAQLRQWSQWLRNTINGAKAFELIETANVQGEGDAPLSSKQYELYIHACLRLTIAAEESFRARKDLEHILFRIQDNAD